MKPSKSETESEAEAKAEAKRESEWSSFEHSFLTVVPGQGYMPHAHIVQGLYHGHIAFRGGKSREQAIEIQQTVEQSVKSGLIPLQPRISIFNTPFQPDQIWDGVRREARAPVRAGEQPARTSR